MVLIKNACIEASSIVQVCLLDHPRLVHQNGQGKSLEARDYSWDYDSFLFHPYIHVIWGRKPLDTPRKKLGEIFWEVSKRGSKFLLVQAKNVGYVWRCAFHFSILVKLNGWFTTHKHNRSIAILISIETYGSAIKVRFFWLESFIRRIYSKV